MDSSAENLDFFNFAARQHGVDDHARAIEAFIARDSLESLITSNGVPREIDFLSLDVDGNDYWFRETRTCERFERQSMVYGRWRRAKPIALMQTGSAAVSRKRSSSKSCRQCRT